MNIESWKQNFLSYINKIDNITENKILDIIIQDKTLTDCVVDFLTPLNFKDIIVLYGKEIWNFKPMILFAKNIICCPILEGVPSNTIEWQNTSPNNYNDLQLSYLILNDTIDPLYEAKLICNQYNIPYNIKNIKIKCLIDNRTSEYKSSKALSIESRSGLIVNAVITTN